MRQSAGSDPCELHVWNKVCRSIVGSVECACWPACLCPTCGPVHPAGLTQPHPQPLFAPSLNPALASVLLDLPPLPSCSRVPNIARNRPQDLFAQNRWAEPGWAGAECVSRGPDERAGRGRAARASGPLLTGKSKTASSGLVRFKGAPHLPSANGRHKYPHSHAICASPSVYLSCLCRTVQRKPQKCPDLDCAGLMVEAELIKP